MSYLLSLACLVLTVASTPVSAATPQGGRIGLNPDDAPDQQRLRFGKFATYLASETGVDQELAVAGSYEELRAQLLSGEISLAVLSPLNYVRTVKSGAKLKLLARLRKYGESGYRSIVIARKGQFDDLKDLGRGTFLYHSQASTSGYLYPTLMLEEHGVDVDRLPKKKIEGDHFALMRAVLEGNMVFGATSTDKFREASARGIETSALSIHLTGEDEIPYDAVVVSLQIPDDQRAGYEGAIGKLLLYEGASFQDIFAPETGVTSIAAAQDRDYHVIRKATAQVEGGSIVRIGLTLSVEPHSKNSKLDGWGAFQRYAYDQHGTFVDLKLYERDRFDEMLTDLLTNRIEVGEFSPIAAGKAIAADLVPLVAPAFDTGVLYESVLIRPSGSEEVRNPGDVEGRKLAVGPRYSASTHVYPLYQVLEEVGVSEGAFELVELSLPGEIISAVATGRADVGAVARFHLDRARENNHAHIDRVEVVPGTKISIPTGAYVANELISGDEDAVDDLRALFLASNSHLEMQSSFGVLELRDIDKMRDTYEWAFPPDRTTFYVLVGAALLVAAAIVVFLVAYDPKRS